MESKQKQITLLIISIILLFTINYSFLDSLAINFLENKESVIVERVIDGDTIVINGTSVRMLGINTPERGEKYSDDAKEFLDDLVLNKNVELKFGKDKYDRYKRILAYIFIGEKNINLELIKNGFANPYFPSGKDIYYNSFNNAWEECIKNNINLCEKSNHKCSNCIKLSGFDYKDEIITLKNICNFDCDLSNWNIKDEGRKNFVISNFVLEKNKDVEIIVTKKENTDTNEKIFWKTSTYVFTNSGDTMFLRDNYGKLVLWERY